MPFDFSKSNLAWPSGYPMGLHIDRAEGIYLWDKQGNRYLDLISGIGVSNVGHRHPKVIEAIKNQVDKYLHVMAYGEFVQDPQEKLATKLVELLPNSLDRVYFVNSGTEANEAAIKLAKRYTGRQEVVSFHHSYHGCTQGSLSVTGNENKKQAFRPLLPGVKFLEFNSIDDLDQITSKTAAVIIEPIQGDAGVRIPSMEFMTELRNTCTKNGAVLIFDEVQTAFGRTGKWFALEHFNVIPDIITLAKALGAGLPVGALAANHKLMDTFKSDPVLGHITTFGGNPLSCASALAGIAVLENEALIESSEKKGQLFEDELSGLGIEEVRRKGLMFAIDLGSAEKVQKVVHQCLEKGLITFWFLSCPSSFRLAPPLTISDEEISYACKILKEVIQ